MQPVTVRITVRDLPETVRDELAARAASNDKSMQAHLREQLERVASRPSIEQWLKGVLRISAPPGRECPPQIFSVTSLKAAAAADARQA